MSRCDVLAGRILKVEYEGDIRRMKLDLPAGATCAQAFSAIQATVAATFNLPQGASASMRLFYTDEENDVCTLTDVTVEDLAVLCPGGPVRLTLKLEGPAIQDAQVPSASCCTAEHDASGNAEAQAQAAEGNEPTVDQDNAGSAGHCGTEANVAELRELLSNLVQKLDPRGREMVKGLLLNMDPNMLKGLAGMVLCGKGIGKGGNHDPMAVRISALVQEVDPSTLRGILEEVFRGASDSADEGHEAPSSSQAAPPANPIEGLLGALFADKGCGRGADAGPATPAGMSPPPMHNPLGDLFRSITAAGKGCGRKGASGGAPQPNPMEFLGTLFAGKGFGKGACGATSPTPSAAADSAAPTATPQCAANAFGEASPTPVDPSKPDGNAAAAAFEKSVADLVEMGLVSDPDMARQLLAECGDFSAVLSLLSDD